MSEPWMEQYERWLVGSDTGRTEDAFRDGFLAREKEIASLRKQLEQAEREREEARAKCAEMLIMLREARYRHLEEYPHDGERGNTSWYLAELNKSILDNPGAPLLEELKELRKDLSALAEQVIIHSQDDWPMSLIEKAQKAQALAAVMEDDNG